MPHGIEVPHSCYGAFFFTRVVQSRVSCKNPVTYLPHSQESLS
ncbi:hypothetical protein VP382E491_P0102, partial [Vibrio phage 382E49-1]